MNGILDWSFTPSGLNYGDLLEAYGVGVGLYLALAIIQAVAGFRLSILTRRLDTLRRAVAAQRFAAQYDDVRSAAGKLANVEITLDSFFELVFRTVVTSFIMSIAGLCNAIVWKDSELWNWALWTILAFLLWLPVLIFILAAGFIRWKCGPVEREIKLISDRVQMRLIQQQLP